MRTRVLPLSLLFMLALALSYVWAVGTSHAHVSAPNVSRPPTSGVWPSDGSFGDRLLRLGGDPNSSITFPEYSDPNIHATSGTWKMAQAYGWKNQAWSPDGSLIMIQNIGGTPPVLFLDAQTLEPKYDNCKGDIVSTYDIRWMPNEINQVVFLTSAGHIKRVTVETCHLIHEWDGSDFPMSVDPNYGIGNHEGVISNDGWMVLSNSSSFFAVNLYAWFDNSRGWPYPSYEDHQYLPLNAPKSLSGCGLGDPENCALGKSSGWVSMTPDSTQVVAMYPAGDNDNIRVWDVNGLDPNNPFTIHSFGTGSVCGGGLKQNGFTVSVGHAGLASFYSNYIVGQRRPQCVTSGDSSNSDGHVIRVDLSASSASATAISDSGDAFVQHVSTLATGTTGDVLASYDDTDPNHPFGGEIVAWPISGVKTPRRWTNEHTDHTGTTCWDTGISDPNDKSDKCEAQGTMDPTGAYMLFNSSWSRYYTGNGPFTDPNTGRYLGLVYIVREDTLEDTCVEQDCPQPECDPNIIPGC